VKFNDDGTIFLEAQVCWKCEALKPREEFGADKRMKDGLKSWCKECLKYYRCVRRTSGHRNPLDLIPPPEPPSSGGYPEKVVKKWITTEVKPKRKPIRPRVDRGACPPADPEDVLRLETVGIFKWSIPTAWRTYGVSARELVVMLDDQDSRCDVCGDPEWGGKDRRPFIDHDHDTGKVRGLLCIKCNTGLGFLKDSPTSNFAAGLYLMDHGREISRETAESVRQRMEDFLAT